MELEKLKRLHDKAYQSGQVTRERAADDIVFAWVTQWDDGLLSDSQLEYKGEFDVLRKALRQILTDLRSNPIQVDFYPIDESRDDGADLMDGLYRTSLRDNTSIEAFDNASMESVVCGVGAWVLSTEYESTRTGDMNQVIKRSPIYEANNNVFWDPNAKLLDKSDARYVSILRPYSEDGYKELVSNLTGEDVDDVVIPSSFSEPEQSYAFPWLGGEDKQIYVTEFYYTEKVRDRVLLFVDPMGQEITVLESQVEDVIDDMQDSGFKVVNERVIERTQVTKAIASGFDILDETPIAGEFIPVIPVYGERAFVEGEEHYEGVTRLAKDPQRLRNFQMSYLADIVSRSPRPKPIFFPEQIQGFEFMYEENGADNNYPYYLQNRKDANGEPLPIGPIAQMPEQPIPMALAASIELSRQAVEDVANPGLPQNIADPDLSGKAVIALQNQVDKQSMVYQQNLKHSMRRDGEVFASMASVTYDAPRSVTITKPDGTQTQAKFMDVVLDEETGKFVTLNDITNIEWKVYSDIGPSYSSQREETLTRIGEMVQGLPPGDPMRNILMLKQIQLIQGVDFKDVRDYARKQLILQGIQEPETDEEKAFLMQAQQGSQQPDANMVLAMAEDKKGEAALIRERRESVKAVADIENQNKQTEIDVFKAVTDRQEAEVSAAKAGADVRLKEQEALRNRVDAAEDLSGVSTEELLAALGV